MLLIIGVDLARMVSLDHAALQALSHDLLLQLHEEEHGEFAGFETLERQVRLGYL